jgi:hypothetical protein
VSFPQEPGQKKPARSKAKKRESFIEAYAILTIVLGLALAIGSWAVEPWWLNALCLFVGFLIAFVGWVFKP